MVWRPFGSSSPSQSNESPNGVSQSANIAVPKRTPPPERVLHFPEDRSVGTLMVRDWNSEGAWRMFGRGGYGASDAEGVVTVREGKDLLLSLDRRRVQDLSFLAGIGEDDLQFLYLSGESGRTIPAPTGTIFLSNPTITDADLRFIRRLRSLRELNLVGVKMSDFGFTQLSALTSLEILDIYEMEIGDAGMEQIGNLTSISELHIGKSNLTDKGLAEIGRLHSLRKLVIWETPHISDAGLMHLQSLTQLEYLDLRSTPISDRGLVHLQSIRSLKRLLLQGIQITPNGVASLKAALPNTQVEVFTPTPSPTPIPPTRPPVS